jgi:hypothetical protein
LEKYATPLIILFFRKENNNISAMQVLSFFSGLMGITTEQLKTGM